MTSLTMPESPFTNLLHTNFAPSDLEADQIKDFLLESTYQMSNLEDEIVRVQRVLDALKDKFHALSAGVEAHRALLLPIRRLPPDVVCEVFVHCLPSDHNAVMSSAEAPMLLGRVCRSWRTIALSTPRLWASLHVSVPDLSGLHQIRNPHHHRTRVQAKINARLLAIQEWLLRSGACPLSLSLFQLQMANNWNMDSLSVQFVETLLPFAHRWKTVDLRVTNTALTRVMDLSKDDIPLLEDLRIDSGLQALSEDDYGQWTSAGIFEATNLCSVSIISYSIQLSGLPISWSRLAHLTFGGITEWNRGLTLSQVWGILKNCPSLESCSLEIDREAASTTANEVQGTLELSFLHTISIMEGIQVDLAPLFRCLILPALHSLKLSKRFGPFHDVFLAPLDILPLLGGSLKKLVLEPHALSASDLITSLSYIPSVTHFKVQDTRKAFVRGSWPTGPPLICEDTVLARMIPLGKTPDCICPALEVFECDAKHSGFSDEMLLDFIRSRSDPTIPGVRKLKQVRVIFDRAREVNIMPELSEIISKGIKVELHYPPPTHSGPYSPWYGVHSEEVDLPPLPYF
ncbi:hypothetical protein BDQ17DRAFT_1352197 [Cyathus striatus]|nr:hypothetical protein BDQ17DRAFT_1352197 [Cyathus striatus]